MFWRYLWQVNPFWKRKKRNITCESVNNMSGAEADKSKCTLDDFVSDQSFDKPLLVVKVDDSRMEGPSGWLESIKEGEAAVHPSLVDFFKKMYGAQLNGVTIPILSEQQIDYYQFLTDRIKRFDKEIKPCTFPHTIYIPAGSAY